MYNQVKQSYHFVYSTHVNNPFLPFLFCKMFGYTVFGLVAKIKGYSIIVALLWESYTLVN